MKKKIFLYVILFFTCFLMFACKNNTTKLEQKKIRNELGLMTLDPYFSDESFEPILRFTVCSDVHTGNTRKDNAQAITRMLKLAYNISDNSTYKNLDAVLVAGDIADNGSEMLWTAFKEELYAALRDNTLPLVVMGNHDFRAYYDNSEEAFSRIFGTPTDFHVVINGIHFICLSPSNEVSFSNEKVEWLDTELSIAAKDDPAKPIFVMQHMNIAGTVIGSSGWGVSELTKVLSKYPQVIDFSGHSHFPMKDPRSIYQGDFTALNDGTMFYYEVGINGYKNYGLNPIDEFGSYSDSAQYALSGVEFYLVEVDKSNAVRISGYDLISNTMIVRYGIKTPSDKTSFTYTSERITNGVEPFFDEEPDIEVTIYDDMFILKFPQAYSVDLLESYRIVVSDDDGNKKTYFALSGYYLNPMPEYIMVTLDGLKSATKYEIDIYAQTVYSKSNSVPLSFELTTK